MTDLDTHPCETHILVSSLYPTVIAYSIKLLRSTSLGHCSVQVMLWPSKLSLLLSTIHRTAKSFDVLPSHPILEGFLDNLLPSIRMVCFIFTRFRDTHFTTLCVLVIVVILFFKLGLYISSLFWKAPKMQKTLGKT